MPTPRNGSVLHLHLRASTGQTEEVRKGGVRSLLANTVEAVIGAIYRDGGLDPASSFILGHILTDIPGYLASTPAQDPKTAFQELMQRERQVTPAYRVTAATGPDNDRDVHRHCQRRQRCHRRGNGKVKAECRAAGGTAGA